MPDTKKIVADFTAAELRLSLYVHSLHCSSSPWEAYHAAYSAYDWIITGRHEADEERGLTEDTPVGGNA